MFYAGFRGATKDIRVQFVQIEEGHSAGLSGSPICFSFLDFNALLPGDWLRC